MKLKSKYTRIKVILNQNGDWEWLYVDDKLYYEGHSIPTEKWLELLEELGCDTENIYDENNLHTV